MYEASFKSTKNLLKGLVFSHHYLGYLKNCSSSPILISVPTLFSRPCSQGSCVHTHTHTYTPLLHIVYGIHSFNKYVPDAVLDAGAMTVREVRSVLT